MVQPPCSPGMSPIKHLLLVVDRPICTQDIKLTNIVSDGQLLRGHGTTSLQMSSKHLWNQCHIKLLGFARLEGVLQNIRHLSHDLVCQCIYEPPNL